MNSPFFAALKLAIPTIGHVVGDQGLLEDLSLLAHCCDRLGKETRDSIHCLCWCWQSEWHFAYVFVLG